jgi:hypothetical protein
MRRSRIALAGEVVWGVTRFDSIGRRPQRSSVRGEVAEFSAASRRRLFCYMSAIPWGAFGRSLFVTLTYPAEFPTDGRVVAKHLQRFDRELVRRFGVKNDDGSLAWAPPAVWVREFHTQRPAAHYHMVVQLPSGVSERRFRAWAKEAWSGIVARGCVVEGVEWPGVLDEENRLRHRDQGVRTELLRGHPAAYFVGYVGDRGRTKVEQHRVPEGFTRPGRYWGMRRCRPEWLVIDLGHNEWRAIVAEMRARREAAGLGNPPNGQRQSQWLRLPGESAVLTVLGLVRYWAGEGPAPPPLGRAGAPARLLATAGSSS